jgi:phage terminase large subunit-like protein
MTTTSLDRLGKLRRLKQLRHDIQRIQRERPSGWYCDRTECDGNPHDRWYHCEHPAGPHPDHQPACRHARTAQRPPEGEWLVWAYIAGRGTGKTRSMAEWVHHEVRQRGACRIALVGRTPDAVREVMIEGETGLLATAPPDLVPDYQPTRRRIVWPNGAIGTTYSSEVPAQLRGPNHDLAWCDEPAAWRDAARGDVLDTAWNNLVLSMRIKGKVPRIGFSTTPKPVKLIRQVLAKPTTRKTHETTYDNLDNLADEFRTKVIEDYEGTRIGRQELLGELLEDIEGALWSIAQIDTLRMASYTPRFWQRTVLALDPADGLEDGDEQALCVVSQSADVCPAECHLDKPGDHHHHLYVRHSDGMRATPWDWLNHAVDVAIEYGATIVAEKNHGGAYLTGMLEQVLQARGVQVPYGTVDAVSGASKMTRAEQVVGLYEQQRVHHLGAHSKLEDQMTGYTGLGRQRSPDRLDALVWALSEFTSTPMRPGNQSLDTVAKWDVGSGDYRSWAS